MPEQFEKLMAKLEPQWETHVAKRYKRPSRHFKMGLQERVLMVLLYYRSYTTQLFVGYLFGIDDSRVCRIIRMLEPMLAKVMAIKKERSLSQKEIEFLIMDGTEQPLEKPKRGQKPYYSGKKKRHTLKTEIRATLKGRIVHVSKTRPGSLHDFTLYKQGTPLLKNTRVYVDSGYQGLDKIHTATELPYKKSKHRPLDVEEKHYNQTLSRIRVKVENVFAQIKVFKILSYPYRNKCKRYNLKFNIIAGLVNMKNGFA